MNTPIHVTRVGVGLSVTLPDELIERNMGYFPWVLGDNLAAQVREHTLNARLGYFPAIEYFRDPARGADQALLALIDEVAQFSVEYAKRELRRRLSRVFSNIKFEQAQCTAYTLPRARLRQPGAVTELGRHYAPSKVKLELLLSSIERERLPNPEEAAIAKLEHWCHEPFVGLDILDARVVG